MTVLWRDFGAHDNPHVISVPKCIEEHAEKLRSRFLAWVYDLGETIIEGKRLVDYLELRQGFSYWWMTLIAQKANAYESPQIADAVKMIALEELGSTNSPSRIILASAIRIWRVSLGCGARMPVRYLNGGN